ncbi:MAG: RNA polymerase sigma factor [Solirubrobacterales bacterium]
MRRAVDAIWRIEAPRLIAGLARFCNGDIGRAEELAQDAVVVALERWPEDGIPRNPGAWLMTTAKNRQIDLARRTAVFRVKTEELGREFELGAEDQVATPAVEDDLLRLIFTTCHPALTRESQVALTLRMLGGLTTTEIARALLSTESTVGTRISRAKRTLADAGSPFEVPEADELDERLAAVLAVVYLIFNEGYSATAGADWMRLDLCEDALRLGRVLQAQLPDHPEVHGLAALMEIQASRSRARTSASGEIVLLLDQDRSRWDRTLIERGYAAIERAHATSGAPGVYTLQAEIAACHARAANADETDWQRIAQLYAGLSELTGSPVVEVNRAMAVGMAEGPAAGLAVIESVADTGALSDYHPLHAVRADLLERAGRHGDAAEEFARAAELTRNDRERAELQRRSTTLRERSTSH